MRRLVAVALAAAQAVAFAPSRGDICGPQLLVLSAFPGEIDLLLTSATGVQPVDAGARTFYTGTLKGNDVVMGLTGIGLVNAEETTELALETFPCISGMVFSGVSGGNSKIGDVTVPTQWSRDGGVTWFQADAGMLATARQVASTVTLGRDVPAGDLACAGVDPRAAHSVTVEHTPTVIVGGDGRSTDPFGGRRLPCYPGGGDVFGCEPCRAPSHAAPDVEGAITGTVPFLHPGFFFGFFQNPPTTSGAAADDMETAAAAAVAADHGIPFIAFRALSDGDGDPLHLPGFPFQFFYYRQFAADNAATVALAFLDALS